MRVAIVNIGTIVSGDLNEPFIKGDTIIADGDCIVAIGTAAARDVESCDVVIDADRTTAIPGLIDSHVHITFGDFTPRQQTVGYLESYVHGGVTTAISASEVHVPGRPRDAEGVKALAVAAHKCFEHYRPGGMKVYAGSVILEPTLSGNDLGEIAKKGVWLAKAGFGAFKTAFEYAPLVAAARAHGMITTCHTGGSSIPGSGAITGDHLLAMKPHVSFHVNGGPTAMPDKDFERIIVEGDMALQVCTAGNLRTSAAVRGAGSASQRLRAPHHRHRHADRKRHHAARHALHHVASREPRRDRTGVVHRRGDRQQRARLRPRVQDISPPARRRISYCSTRRTAGPRTMRCRRSGTATSRRSAPSSRAVNHGSSAAAAILRRPRATSASRAARSRAISRACGNDRRQDRRICLIFGRPSRMCRRR